MNFSTGISNQDSALSLELRRSQKRSSLPRRILRYLLLAIAGFYAVVVLMLLGLRFINPFTTAVQIQRRVEALLARRAYSKTQTFVPLNAISPALQHAVVAAEDARFYQHHGFDWTEVENAIEESRDGGRTRGASTITQQLVKNLFLTTSRSYVRKGIEFTIVPLAELILGKQRTLDLYLNVIEWGPGIYGAEAAARTYYRMPARRLSREQALDLATVIPAPLRRKPGRLPDYAAVIAGRMAQMGW
jgi:monofunctional biosynthetic peptidoglycan transglycosylase